MAAAVRICPTAGVPVMEKFAAPLLTTRTWPELFGSAKNGNGSALAVARALVLLNEVAGLLLPVVLGVLAAPELIDTGCVVTTSAKPFWSL